MSGPGLDCGPLVERAERHGVLIERGDIFFQGERPPRNHFRIGFAAVGLPAAAPGIARLGAVCGELLDEENRCHG
jgi:GntR family transcriptional regulator/MocR family aminotransferase